VKETITINSLEELTTLARKILSELELEADIRKEATVLALSGDLGAGKTTFVQLLAKELLITEVVTSPTFTIMKMYEVGAGRQFENLIHMDAYRIESEEELRPLRLLELLQNPKSLICIEWAEKIKDILPKDTIHLNFSIKDGEGREIVVERP
jgi:tRNA threonylcarbamoyladenosine biosynthesis protein TsaE